jgi:hypothetical protein
MPYEFTVYLYLTVNDSDDPQVAHLFCREIQTSTPPFIGKILQLTIGRNIGDNQYSLKIDSVTDSEQLEIPDLPAEDELETSVCCTLKDEEAKKALATIDADPRWDRLSGRIKNK